MAGRTGRERPARHRAAAGAVSALVVVAMLAACTSTDDETAVASSPSPGPDSSTGSSSATRGESSTAPPAASSATPSPSPSTSSSPTPTPTPSPTASPTPPGPDRTALVRLLRRAAAAIPDEVDASVAILDNEGRLVFGVAPDRGLLPASTAKLLSGAAALEVFGPDHRFVTTVRHTGSVVDGVLTGSLVLEGGGDPVLDSGTYRSMVYLSRPHTELEQLAEAVVAAGITTVRGRIVVEADRFGPLVDAPGWKDSYVPLLEARRIRSLTVDAGLAVRVVEPAPELQLEILAADDPQQMTGILFRRALRAAGVRLPDEPRPPKPSPTPSPSESDQADEDVEDPPPPPPPPVAVRAAGPPVEGLPVVAQIESPPLSELLQFAFEQSDNHISDTLFRAVGAERDATGWRESGEVVTEVVGQLGVDTTGMRLTDGSGLSRSHAVSASHLAAVAWRQRNGPDADAWRRALAVAGEEGTLRRRLRGTVAEGRFLGKTGTLDDVTAVAGTVEGPDGAPAFHVAMLGNVPPSLGRFSTLVVFDDLIALLAEDVAGCVRVPQPGETSSDGGSPAPGEVVGGLSVRCQSPPPSSTPSPSPPPSSSEAVSPPASSSP